ncbi:eosinophil peroxidase-like [Pelodytes ibericus]
MAYLQIVFGILLVVTAGIQRTYSDDAVSISDSLITATLMKAELIVDRALKATDEKIKCRMAKKNVKLADLMSQLRQPRGASRNIAIAAEIMHVTFNLLTEEMKCAKPTPFNITDLLTNEQIERILQHTGCINQRPNKVCPKNSPYRTITGECNNRKRPSLGASNSALKRLIPPQYEDTFSLPRSWNKNHTYHGFPLPMTRDVSNKIIAFTKPATLDDSRSLMFMQWGQLMDHDFLLSAASPASVAFYTGVDCESSCAREEPCFPIEIPPNDPRVKNQSDCLPVTRTAAVCNPDSLVREQINARTSFLDGSQVYGSEEKEANSLRNNTNDLGLLAINQDFTDKGFSYLPFDTVNGGACIKSNLSANTSCFLAGDNRVSEQPGLTVLQTLFMREHNNIATQMHKLNPSLNGEKLFQESRKIVVAILQKITYREYVPLLIGYNLSKFLPPYTSYNESEDPRVSNIFTIAFRFGHATVQQYIYRLDQDYTPYKPAPKTPIHQTFLNSWDVLHKGGISTLLRGLLANKAKLSTPDQLMVEGLRDHLFQSTERIPLDLGSLNVHRAREHGLAGYNEWRRYCGLHAPRNLSELAAVMNCTETAQKMMTLYKTPENIDFWVGALAEPHVKGGKIGELGRCIISDQFRRTRDADRFFYLAKSIFTKDQIKEIEKRSLSHIICENTDIKKVPRNVFLSNEYPRDFLQCSSFPKLDLSPWIKKIIAPTSLAIAPTPPDYALITCHSTTLHGTCQ